jgi:tetratricopeptide (TPR) repeat protein
MHSNAVSKKPSLWFWACWLALAATYVLFAAATFFPDRRLWGVNHLAFYPPAVRLVVLAVTGVFLIPPLASATWRAIVFVTRPYFRGLASGYNAIALSGVASFVIFAAFRASTLLLGDGYFIINTFEKAAQNNMNIGAYFSLVSVRERIYPATELLNYAASWTASRFGASPVGGVWILNCAIGAVVVVGVLAAIRKTEWSEGAKLAVGMMVLLTGAIQLFFGYVEHYTPALALGALYVLLCLRALSGRGRLWKPGVVLLIAILFHVESLLLVPSYVWLLAWSAARKRKPALGGRLAFALGAATVVVAVAAGVSPAIGRFYLPPLGPADGYHVFSAAHLLDVANEVILLCPAWLLFAVLIARRRRLGRREASGSDGGALAYAGMLAVPAWTFLFIFRPELGMARDWDLFAFTIFGLAAPGLIAFSGYATRPHRYGRSAVIVSAAVVLSAAMVFSWVGVNADTERSVARYQAILDYDRTNPGYAYEVLARHFEDEFQFSREMEALRLAYDTSHNPRYMLKMGRALYDHDDKAGAMKWYRRYVEAKPDDDDARKLLLGLLALENRIDEMIPISLAGIAHSPKVPEFYFFLGNAYLAKGMKEQGLKAFAKCSQLNPPPLMVEAMGKLMEQAGVGPPQEK